MAFAATVAWEVQTLGSDNNGGGFDAVSGVPGTDYTYGAGQTVIAYTDIAIDATVNTKCTSALRNFVAADVGNIINITGGTGFTVQRVQIMSVTAGAATVDKSLGTLGSTGGTGNLGGALASPGMAGALHVSGNKIWVKAGTYTVTSATSNISSGCVTLAAGTAGAATHLEGYQATRGDKGSFPVIRSDSIITTFVLLTMANATSVENLEYDGNSRTSSRGIDALSTNSLILRCRARNCTNSGFRATSNAPYFALCSATGCATQPAFLNTECWSCVAYSNTVSGFSSNSPLQRCLSINNSGASSDGFTGASLTCRNCVAYNNGRDGFRATSGTTVAPITNCIAESNAGWGFNASAAYDGIYLFNCAGYNNTSGNVSTNVTSGNNIGFVTGAATFFVAAGSNNFAPSSAAKAVGLPGSSGSYQLPDLSTLSYPDIGAAQASDLGSIYVETMNTVVGVPVRSVAY